MAFTIQVDTQTNRYVDGALFDRYIVSTAAASRIRNGTTPINVYWDAGGTTVTLDGFASAQTNPTGTYHFRWNNVNYHFDGSNIKTSTGTSREINVTATSNADGDPNSGTNGGLSKLLDTASASPNTTADGAYDADGSSGSAGTNFHVLSTAGFPAATTDNPQSAIVGTDVFTYTGTNDDGFTGVSGLSDVSANAVVRPLIDCWETDDLHDLMTALGNYNSGNTFSTTRNNNDPGIQEWTLTNQVDSSRSIISCCARIAHEEDGETVINVTQSGGTNPKLWLQLCGTDNGTDSAKVTLGNIKAGVSTGIVRLRYNGSPGWGDLRLKDDLVQSDGSLIASTANPNGYTPYLLLMGLAGPTGWFYTNHDGNSPVYIFEFENLLSGNANRFDFSTWDNGMSGNVAMAAYGNRTGDFSHVYANNYTLTTFTVPFKDVENISPTWVAEDNIITGTGGGGQTTTNIPEVWPLSTLRDEQFQRIDIDRFEVSDSVLNGNTSGVAYNYPNKLFRNLGFNAACNHSIIYTPGGRKPPGNKMDIQRTRHGATGGTLGAWHYLLGITPQTQDTGGLEHPHSAMLVSRTYVSGVSSTVSVAADASANPTTLAVASTAGFRTTGSLTVSTQSVPITYTGISGNTFTGIPASGGGSITADIPVGTTVDETAAYNFNNYVTGNGGNTISLSNGSGKSQTSFNPDIVQLDSGDQGSVKRGPSDSSGAFGYYAWKLDDDGKNGGVLHYGVSHRTTGNPVNYYYNGTYDVYYAAPGRPTIMQTLRPIDFSGTLAVTNQAPIISHNLYPGLTLSSNGTLSEAQSLVFEQDASTGSNLLNLDDGSNHDFRSWSTGATHNCTRWLATISSIPYTVTNAWDAKSRGSGSSPSAGSKYADWNEYRAHNGIFARMAEFDNDFIQSVSGSKFIIKNPANGDLTINCNFKPIQDSTYDTIEISDGGTNYGNWDLNGGGLECDASSNPHAYLQGNLTDVRTYTTLAAAKAGSAFTVKGHDRMKGTMTVNVTNADVYVSFKDCSRDGSESFQIIRTGTGTGRLLAVNPPAGTTIVAASGATDNNSIVQEIQVTRPVLSGETASSNVKGRFTMYNGSTVIRDFVASGTGVTVSSGTVTYSVNTTESGITIPSTDFTLTSVWSGPGGQDYRDTRTKSSGALEFSITLATQDEAPSTAVVPSAITETFELSNTEFKIFLGMSNGSSILNSTTGTWKWLDDDVRGSVMYNDWIRRASSNLNQITNQGDYAQVYGEKITITVATTDPKDQNLGYIQNLSTGAGNEITESNTISGTEYFVYLTADAPGNSVGALRQALGDYGTATTTDVNNARNQTIGALS